VTWTRSLETGASSFAACCGCGAGANLSETDGHSRSTSVRCPVSLDVVRAHLGDLRRARSGETPFSGLSHLIWSAMAILSALSHLIWSAKAVLSALSHSIWPTARAPAFCEVVRFVTCCRIVERRHERSGSWGFPQPHDPDGRPCLPTHHPRSQPLWPTSPTPTPVHLQDADTPHLLTYLAAVPDPRAARGRRHLPCVQTSHAAVTPPDTTTPSTNLTGSY
jgi:hypothetical protein